MMLYLLMLLPLCASAGFCTDKADGSYDAGCRSYTRCSGGKSDIIDCTYGLVYNSNTGVCDNPKNVPAPCGIWQDCSNLDDGRYADLGMQCASYFTCYNHIFLGNNPCPGGLVFNEEDQLCDWKRDTKAPCGTKQ